MHDEKYEVRLSGREAMYLRNAAFLPDELARIISAAVTGEKDGIVISLPRNLSERFRAVFTQHLAKVGFDDAYEPTSEGKVLEGLIDRFFVQ